MGALHDHNPSAAMKRVGSPSHSSRVGFPPGRVATRRREVAGGHGVPGLEVVPRSLGSWGPERTLPVSLRNERGISEGQQGQAFIFSSQE